MSAQDILNQLPVMPDQVTDKQIADVLLKAAHLESEIRKLHLQQNAAAKFTDPAHDAPEQIARFLGDAELRVVNVCSWLEQALTERRNNPA